MIHTVRGREVVSQEPHKLQTAGSIPAPAIRRKYSRHGIASHAVTGPLDALLEGPDRAV